MASISGSGQLKLNSFNERRAELSAASSGKTGQVSIAVFSGFSENKPKLNPLNKLFNVAVKVDVDNESGYIVLNKNSLKKRLGIDSKEFEQHEKAGTLEDLIYKKFGEIEQAKSLILTKINQASDDELDPATMTKSPQPRKPSWKAAKEIVKNTFREQMERMQGVRGAAGRRERTLPAQKPLNAPQQEEAAMKKSEGAIFANFKRLADEGDVEALRNLGAMYEKGIGVKQDYKKAMQCYTKAYNSGDWQSTIKIGLMYENGLGVKKDLIKAINLFTEAQKNAVSQLKEHIEKHQTSQVISNPDRAILDNFLAVCSTRNSFDDPPPNSFTSEESRGSKLHNFKAVSNEIPKRAPLFDYGKEYAKGGDYRDEGSVNYDIWRTRQVLRLLVALEKDLASAKSASKTREIVVKDDAYDSGDELP